MRDSLTRPSFLGVPQATLPESVDPLLPFARRGRVDYWPLAGDLAGVGLDTPALAATVAGWIPSNVGDLLAVERGVVNVNLYPPARALAQGLPPYTDGAAGSVWRGNERFRGMPILSHPAAGNRYWYSAHTDNVTTSAAWTVSVYLRRHDRAPITHVSLFLRTDGGNGFHDSLVTAAAGQIHDAGNGWYRAHLSVTLPVAKTHFLSGCAGNTNGTADGYDITGWQVETAPFPTSAVAAPDAATVGTLRPVADPSPVPAPLNPQQGTVAFWLHVPTAVGYASIASTCAGAFSEVFVHTTGLMYWETNGSAAFATADGTQNGAKSYGPGSLVFVVLTYTPTGRRFTVFHPAAGTTHTGNAPAVSADALVAVRLGVVSRHGATYLSNPAFGGLFVSDYALTVDEERLLFAAGRLGARRDSAPGTVAMCAGPAAPGWLLCDGQTVRRTLYPRLYAALGTTYGAGDGAHTFSLPDLRSRFPMGADPTVAPLAKEGGGLLVDVGVIDVGGKFGDLTPHPLGATGGLERVNLGTSDLPEHSHFVDTVEVAAADGKGPVTVAAPFGAFGGSDAETSYTGSNLSHDNVPPFLALNFAVRP